MKPIITISILFSLLAGSLYAQTGTSFKSSEKEYSFIIQDSPAKLFTMRQFDESALSLYRLSVNELNKVVSPKVSRLIQVGASALVFLPLTHEEGHRSILTNENIGSVSRPYFDKNLAAYVVGVRDKDLMSLRNNNLPVYIRLHTAGLESDYAMLLRESALLNFREEDPEVLLIEYQMRKVSLIFYYGYGLLKADIGIKEETNELKRDIVGHDIYGAVRHLHRPDMDFHRYTNYDDLTGEEKRFVKRVGWRSLLNLIDPLLIGKTGFRIHRDYRLNFNLGYGMAPFGDYIDEHFWLSAHDGVKTHLYIRQFENKNTWFPAFGVDFSNIKIGQKVTLNASAHGWKQPEAMSFTQTSGKPGGAIDVMGKYRFFSSRKQGVKGISVNIGVLAKSKGFLLEEVNLGRHFGIRFGTSIWL